jgi:hypothetical protein
MDGLPQRWWQWALMYPTVLVALIGAVPQYYQWASAATMGLPISGNVKGAEEQEMAWERNVSCLRGIDHIKPGSSTNYSIDLVSCPSGDILVTLTPLQNPDQQVSRWIVTKNLFTRVAQSLFSSEAWAQGPVPPSGGPVQVRILDTKKDGSIVTRRVQLSDNTCIDETIDPYTGRRLERKKSPCSKF